MNLRIKEEWVSRLESGLYQQGKEVLRQPTGLIAQLRAADDKFCCLGVLCEIYREEKGLGLDYNLSNNEEEFPCNEVVIWAELGDKDPVVKNKHIPNSYTTVTLSQLNDYGVPFSEIAQIIKKQL